LGGCADDLRAGRFADQFVNRSIREWGGVHREFGMRLINNELLRENDNERGEGGDRRGYTVYKIRGYVYWAGCLDMGFGKNNLEND
jgi:hypothetical protein